MQALIAGVDADGNPAQTAKQAPEHADSCAPNSDYEAGSDWRDVHLAVLIAFEGGTSFHYIPFGASKKEILMLNAGDIVIFRGDLVHCGGPYFGLNVRGHVYIDSPMALTPRDHGDTFPVSVHREQVTSAERRANKALLRIVNLQNQMREAQKAYKRALREAGGRVVDEVEDTLPLFSLSGDDDAAISEDDAPHDAAVAAASAAPPQESSEKLPRVELCSQSTQTELPVRVLADQREGVVLFEDEAKRDRAAKREAAIEEAVTESFGPLSLTAEVLPPSRVMVEMYYKIVNTRSDEEAKTWRLEVDCVDSPRAVLTKIFRDLSDEVSLSLV